MKAVAQPRATAFWHALPNGRVQCDLCPNYCRMAEGQRGACFVRANEGGQVVLTTYGRSSGFCVDPIEKKPLFHFFPGTPVLSFGTAGCNLTCRFCQNWEMSKSRETDTLADRADPETIATRAAALGCTSVAFTYNDPVIFLEYAVDIAAACREHGIRTVAVTAGYINPEPRREMFAAMDAANVDLKGFSEQFYQRFCGATLADVLSTLVYIREQTDVWLEVTTLLIPGENDSEAELHDMTRWVANNLGPDTPLHFTAFHPDYKMLDTPPTPPLTLLRARDLAKANGLRFVYTGNIRHPESQQTFCPSCGQLLIGRDGFAVTHYALTETGACPGCGQVCPGVFGVGQGRWGGRRRPVRMDA